MSNYRYESQNTQGMMSLFTAMFAPPVAVPVGRRNALALRARNPKLSRKPRAPRSRLQQAICQALLASALGSGLTGMLIAYNFRNAIEAQATQLVTTIRG